MNRIGVLKFTPARGKIFLVLIIIFFVFPALAGLLGKLPIVWFLGIVAHLFSKYRAYGPGIIFGEPLFELTELGMEPRGFLGNTALFLFYFIIAFLLSWPGNYWKTKKN